MAIKINLSLEFFPEDDAFDDYANLERAGDRLRGAIRRAYPRLESTEFELEVTSIEGPYKKGGER